MEKTNKPTKIIIIEGCDGSGKTTMVENLKNFINETRKDYSADTVAYPHKGYFGYDKIREILSGKIKVPPDIAQSLFLMNYIDSIENFVNPYFETTNKILIMDRSIISTIVYNKVSNGRILESIIQYLYKDDCLHTFDIDSINKSYCNMKGSIDKIFFLNPPLEIITQHSRNRLLENKKVDDNDKLESVIKQYKYYNNFYDSIKKLNNNINKIYSLDEWSYNLSEKENYLSIQNKIMEYLELDIL